MQNGIDVALPSSQIDEHLSRGSSTCLFAPSKSTLKTRRKRLSSTTQGIIRDFGKEPECSRRRQGIRMGMSPFDVRLYYRVIDPFLHLVRRNERECGRHPARFFRRRDTICKFEVHPEIFERKSQYYIFTKVR